MNIYKIKFHPHARTEKEEYFFTSLAAIFTVFSTEQIGMSLGSLWNKRFTPEMVVKTVNCIISKHEIITKKQKK